MVSPRDCTEFQVFVMIYLYGRQVEGMPDAIQVLTIQELANATPDKIFPDDGDEVRKQLDDLVDKKLLVKKHPSGLYVLNNVDGVIFARKYLGGLPQNKDIINKTPGENKVRNFFAELFKKLREKSEDEIAKTLVSEAIKYGSLTATIFLAYMVHHIWH